MAFRHSDSQALLEIHKALFQIYETSLSHPLSIICSHEHRTWLVRLREQIETAWLAFEVYDFQKSANKIPPESIIENPELLCSWIKDQANYRSKTDELVLDFFKNSATDEHFKIFVQSDAILNYRFCDALALAQIHFSEEVKAEIVHNMWDEIGHGILSKLHSREFTKLLRDLNLEQPKASVWQQDWRPYYGHNLYFLFGLSRKHFFKALGSLTMPELFDPRRDQAIVDGLKRVYSDSINYDFYLHHIETDMSHGKSWLDNVISPIVRSQKEAGKQKEACQELALGCVLRMKAMRYYNHYLADSFDIQID